MILEVATLNVIPGQESAFESAFHRAALILASMPGYISHELRRSIEHPAATSSSSDGRPSKTTPLAFAARRNIRNGRRSCTASTILPHRRALRRVALIMTDMASAITIRKAQPQDAGAIAACLESTFAPFRSQYTAAAFADTILSSEGVLDRMAHMTIYAAVTPVGEIVGTVATAVVDQVGHLRGMAVRPDWQGRAIAERLLRVAEDEVRTAGYHRITLNTTAPLLRAIRFYERNGYTPSGEVSDFFGMPLHEYVKQLRPT